MKVQYINSILNSIKAVFVSMLDMSVKFKDPTRKELLHPSYDISSIIEIDGKISGCIVLSFPSRLAARVASEMLDENYTKMNDKVIDVVNEIANMITGMADTELEIEDVSYSLPKVIAGNKSISYPDQSFVFSMPCIMKSGTFEVDIALYDSSSVIIEKEMSPCTPKSCP